MPTDWKREYLKGFADVAGNIRRANRYVDGSDRVRLDVLNYQTNWEMPVLLCTLLEEHLKIPIQLITWGHPNMGRDFREHQINIFKVDIVGFVHHPNRPTDLVFVECKNTKLTLAHLSQLLGYSRITRPLYSFLISPVGFSRSLVSLLQEYHRHDVLEYHSEAGKLPRQVIVAQWEMTGRHLDRNAMIGGAGL